MALETGADIDALVQLLKKRLGLIKHFAKLGDSDDLSSATVEEPGRTGYVRVRLDIDDVPYRTVKSGLLGAYSPNPGSPVIIGYDEKGDLAIEKADFDAIVEANGNPAILNSGNPAMSAFNQTDGLLPLFCGAVSGTVGTLTSEVFIEPWRYVDGDTVRWYQGALLDLTALVPAANLHRYIVIFLKLDDLTIEIGSSTAIATITPLQEADKQECFTGRSNETIPIALWRLHDAQTVVTNADKIEDLRLWLSPSDAKGRITPPQHVRTTAATYNIVSGDTEIFANTDSNAVTVNLLAGVENLPPIRIVNTGTSNAAVTITPNGVEKLIGLNNSFILLDGESLIISYDTTDGWY